MITSPSFSIIVPSFNQGRFIADTLNSLLDQNYPHLEIIVMDGGSTDETLSILKSYGAQIRWISRPDEGQTDAIIKGFQLAQNDWWSWLNADDIHTHCTLHVVAKKIVGSPYADVIFGKGHYMDIEGQYMKPYPTVELLPNISVQNIFFESGYLAQPSVFFHKKAYHRSGGLDPKLKFVMDYALWLRLACSGAHFVQIDEDLSGNRWYASTKTASQTLELYAEAATVQKKEKGRVSAYFIQSTSDYLHSIFRKGRDAPFELYYRWFFFKCVWIWLNGHRPLYCLFGLFTETIAKTNPIVGDRMAFRDHVRCLKQIFKQLPGLIFRF